MHPSSLFMESEAGGLRWWLGPYLDIGFCFHRVTLLADITVAVNIQASLRLYEVQYFGRFCVHIRPVIVCNRGLGFCFCRKWRFRRLR